MGQEHTTPEQKALRKERAGRPSKAFLAALRPAGAEEYKALEKACVQAIVGDLAHVVVEVPCVFKFPKDFPRRKLLTRTRTHLRIQLNAAKTLAWLNQRGHAEVTMADITAAKIRFTLMKGALLDSLEQPL